MRLPVFILPLVASVLPVFILPLVASVWNPKSNSKNNTTTTMDHESGPEPSPSGFIAKKYSPEWSTERTDPTKAEYWDLFAADPEVANRRSARLREKARREHGGEYVDGILWGRKHHPLKAHRQHDFRLKPRELAVLKQHGVVVPERWKVESFAEAYRRLYTDDLPVFVTADSVLHAWHRSFDAILRDTETRTLVPDLGRLLEILRRRLPLVACETTRRDLDYYLAVASSLLSSSPGEDEYEEADGHPNRNGTPWTMPENEERTVATLSAIEREQTTGIVLFGNTRTEDFSQFKPRGHYETEEVLRRYFRAMMWLGRIDFRLTGRESSLEQIRSAVTLVRLLFRSGGDDGRNTWERLETILRMFVGEVDSMTPSQLMDALDGMPDFREWNNNGGEEDDDLVIGYIDDPTAERIRLRLMESDVGNQRINGAVRVHEGPNDEPLPKSFALFGQRFTLDGFALSRMVHPRKRRVPSALDVAFTVLRNDHTVPELARRAAATTTTGGVPFRDGFPHHGDDLEATREHIDRLEDSEWSRSLSSMWLDCLRELSRAPPRFRSEAWAMRLLGTQLASYTELKHDTVLYAKQSHTGVMSTCEYADVFVEPVPEFWNKLRLMAQRAAVGLGTDRKVREFFWEFAATVGRLEEASRKLVEDRPLEKDEREFLGSVIEVHRGSGRVTYSGWYPKLFYGDSQSCDRWDPLVADIHTDPADPMVGDPGCIVHTAVGNVLIGLFTVEQRRQPNGGSDGGESTTTTRIFAGPVFSCYEFLRPIDQRMTDGEWKQILENPMLAEPMPDLPEWATSTYLVPDNDRKAVANSGRSNFLSSVRIYVPMMVAMVSSSILFVRWKQ